MIVYEDESLAKYTTFKMGGIAQKMFFPESVDELLQLLSEKPELYNHIISGGSNILINDSKVFSNVLSMSKVDNRIEKREDGTFYIGASMRIQKVIKYINELGYGGIEYLFSLPALMGGIIYMNAGRGKSFNKSISDFILSVDYIENGVIKSIRKEDCQFSYRKSIFQRLQNCVIIGAIFKFPEQLKEIGESLINERIELCKTKQDASRPNFGSVFCSFDKYIMKIVQKIGLGRKKGCHFSKKTLNWILHESDGDFKETVGLIKQVEFLHRMIGKKCEVEVRIWE